MQRSILVHVGHAQLRQGTTRAGRAHRSWRRAGTFPKCPRRSDEMIGPEHAKVILEQALKASTAEQTEVMLFAQDMELTRFANNIIHQNVAETDTTLTIRAVMGKRRGMATTNNLSAEGIARAVD